MLRAIGVATLDELVDADRARRTSEFAGVLDLPAPVSEAEVLDELRALAAKNQVCEVVHRHGLLTTASRRR